MASFNRLRGLGPIGSAIANLLTFLTTNWQVVASAIAAIGAGAIGWLRALVLSPAAVAAAVLFLTVLWTIVGITVLLDRRRPRAIRPHVDYRYGLTFEGFIPRYILPSLSFPDAGSLHFAFMVRNFTQSPMKYEIEHVDIRLGTRAIPRVPSGTIKGFMARGAGRMSSIRGFTKDQLAEFYNNGNNPAKGSVEVLYVYGPPDGSPERRLRIDIEIYVMLEKDGESFGWQDSIISEEDEPISPRH